MGRQPLKEAQAAVDKDRVAVKPGQIEALVERKRRVFGPDRRTVGRWAVERRGPNERTVWMETAVPPDLAQQAARAGVLPGR